MTTKQILATDYGRLGYMFGARTLADARERGKNPTPRAIGSAAWQAGKYDGLSPEDQRAYAEGAEAGAFDMRMRNQNAAARARLAKYA